MIELKNSKTTELQPKNGRRRFGVDCSIGASWMIDERGVLHTIDPLKPETLPYVPEIGVKDAMPWFHHKSRQSGEFFISLRQAYSGRNLITPSFRDPIEKGNQTIWYDFYPDMDLVIVKGLTTMSLQCLLKGPNAPLIVEKNIEEYPGIARLRPTGPAFCMAEEISPKETGIVRLVEAISGGRRETIILPQSPKWPILANATIDEQIGAGLDDAYAREAANTNTTPYVIFPDGGSPEEFPFFRFQPGIPSGATLGNGCYMKGYLFGTYTEGVVRLQQTDENDPADFTNNPWSRSVTGSTVDWTVESGSAGDPDTSPEIKTIFQDKVDRGDYDSTDHIVIRGSQVSGGTNFIRAYEYAGNAHGAEIRIEYSVAAAVGFTQVIIL